MPNKSKCTVCADTREIRDEDGRRPCEVCVCSECQEPLDGPHGVCANDCDLQAAA